MTSSRTIWKAPSRAPSWIFSDVPADNWNLAKTWWERVSTRQQRKQVRSGVTELPWRQSCSHTNKEGHNKRTYSISAILSRRIICTRGGKTTVQEKDSCSRLNPYNCTSTYTTHTHWNWRQHKAGAQDALLWLACTLQSCPGFEKCTSQEQKKTCATTKRWTPQIRINSLTANFPWVESITKWQTNYNSK